MSLPILPGATSQSVYIKAIDNTTGLAATTVTSATAGLSISYQNTQTGTVTAISLSDLAASNSAWSSGGMKHIAGGVYRLCIPDAAVPATEGARTIISGAATAFQILGCELVGKPVEVVSGSLVAASVSGAVGSVTGAVGSVTGNVGGNVAGSVGSVATGGITSASFASGATIPRVTLADTLTTYTGNTPQTGDSYARIGAPAGASVSADIASNTGSLSTLLARIGAFTGTGINTVLGFFKALAKSDASAPSDMGGTFNPATDSLEAAADNGSGGATAAEVWAYATRTLTQGASSVTAAVTGSSVTVYRGTRWSIALTGLPANTGYTAIILSVKRRESDADSAAIFQVRTTTGLTAFAGAPTVTAGQAAITVNSSTAITITAEAATTVYATPGTYSYGIKYLDASGFPSQASDGGVWTVVGDIPKAIS